MENLTDEQKVELVNNADLGFTIDDIDDVTILDDDDADNLASDSIKETIWAFNASFLAAHTNVSEDAIQSIQANDKCEDNNEVLTELITDLDHFVQDAISADGRGHFVNSYDGEEYELSHKGETFFVYRN